MRCVCVYVCINECVFICIICHYQRTHTNLLWLEHLKANSGGSGASTFCADNDLALVIFGWTDAAHNLTG